MEPTQFIEMILIAFIAGLGYWIRNIGERLRQAEQAIAALKKSETNDYNQLQCLPNIKSDIATLKAQMSLLLKSHGITDSDK